MMSESVASTLEPYGSEVVHALAEGTATNRVALSVVSLTVCSQGLPDMEALPDTSAKKSCPWFAAEATNSKSIFRTALVHTD